MFFSKIKYQQLAVKQYKGEFPTESKKENLGKYSVKELTIFAFLQQSENIYGMFCCDHPTHVNPPKKRKCPILLFKKASGSFKWHFWTILRKTVNLQGFRLTAETKQKVPNFWIIKSCMNSLKK